MGLDEGRKVGESDIIAVGDTEGEELGELVINSKIGSPITTLSPTISVTMFPRPYERKFSSIFTGVVIVVVDDCGGSKISMLRLTMPPA